MILNLLIINLIMVLVHESGFIENADDWFYDRFKPYHMPYPILCLLCGTWWLSLLYVILAGHFTLPAVLLCLLNAHLTEITRPLFRTGMNILLKGIGWINSWL